MDSFLQITSRVFFGEPGPWFNKMEMDGDKTTIFHDIDGSVSEYPGAFLVKDDNWLLRHPDCIDIPDWRAAICSGRYAQVCPAQSWHTVVLVAANSNMPMFGARSLHLSSRGHIHANSARSRAVAKDSEKPDTLLGFQM